MYPFYNNNQELFPMIPFFPASRRRVPTIDNRGIYELCTTGIVEDDMSEDARVDFGINPRVWRALPNECVAIWKVRHPVTQTGASYAVNVVVPTGNTSSTVTSNNTIAGTTKVKVQDNKGTQVEGRDVNVPTGSGNDEQVSYTTEHWVYINKCAGIFRLLGVTAQNSPARATGSDTTPETPAS